MTAAKRVLTFWERNETTIFRSALSLISAAIISLASIAYALQARVTVEETKMQRVEKALERFDETADLVQRMAGKMGIR